MSSQMALGPEGPFRHEHAGHRHAHEDVGDVDVPPRMVTSGHGEDQQDQAVTRPPPT